MRQVFQKSYMSSELCVSDVPAPALSGEGVIVQNAASLISPGTERAAVAFARMNPVEKVRSQPERLRLLFRKARQTGWVEALRLAKNKLENPIPLGYSTAGVVREVSEGLSSFKTGDRVACAGAGHANHAETVYIPKNLCVPLPDTLSFEEGAFVAPGAIALHGLRLANIQLGETVLVIGLGLIGQLAWQLVQAQGATAIGVDLSPERLNLARELGLAHACHRNDSSLAARVEELTSGLGVDVVLVCAGTPSHDPVTLAGELCRERGKVVIVGDVGMQIPRSIYYRKELSLLISRSYGPGRYDEGYEQHGQAYPKAYVRWSERDNMAAFLQLAAAGKVRLKPLIERRYPVDRAKEAYDLLTNPDVSPQPLGIVLEYPSIDAAPNCTLQLAPQVAPVTGQIGAGVIGAGSFMNSILLPVLQRENRLILRGVVAKTGLSAVSTGKKARFAYCATEPETLYQDDAIQAVLIATRHDSHARLVCEALSHGRHVFVEKPLATTRDELAACARAMAANPTLQVMVGYNRRFAPLTLDLQRQLAGNAGPMSIHYWVLAGELPAEHWAHGHGGRIVGEACHFIDWCQAVTGADPVEVRARRVGSGINHDVLMQIVFADGSVAHLDYLMRIDAATVAALGKERISVTAPGIVAELLDFQELRVTRTGKTRKTRLKKPDKGHQAEIGMFINALQTGQPAISAESLLLTAATALAVMESLQTGHAVSLLLPEA